MWKVAVVQPVTEGFGFNITTETNLPLVGQRAGIELLCRPGPPYRN